MVPSMVELIFFYILQKSIQGYDSHYLCARVTVPCIFSGARQQNFAGAGLLYTLAWLLTLKMRQQNLWCNHASSSPPKGSGNGGGCGNNHRKVNAMTMTTTTTADADAYADAPQQLQQQQQLPQQQWRIGKR
jgi:hypothetical protein